MFTKRQYELLAKLIKRNLDLELFTEDLIRAMYYDNPKFDEEKFREAIRR